MPNFSFGCATRVAAKRGRTAAQQHSSTAALPHGRTARLHGGTEHHRKAAPHGSKHGMAARQHSTAHGCTAAPLVWTRLHVCTSARRHGRAAARRHGYTARPHSGSAVQPHCENCGRATNETEPARIVAASASEASGSTLAPASSRPLSRPRARTAAARPRATERRWRRQSVHTPLGIGWDYSRAHSAPDSARAVAES